MPWTWEDAAVAAEQIAKDLVRQADALFSYEALCLAPDPPTERAPAVPDAIAEAL